jgi:hypothetical protein
MNNITKKQKIEKNKKLCSSVPALDMRVKSVDRVTACPKAVASHTENAEAESAEFFRS